MVCGFVVCFSNNQDFPENKENIYSNGISVYVVIMFLPSLSRVSELRPNKVFSVNFITQLGLKYTVIPRFNISVVHKKT